MSNVVSDVTGKELWGRPQIKVTMKDGAQLEEVAKIQRASALLSRLEAILHGKDGKWRAYAIKSENEGIVRLKLIGRFEGRERWARRGDFEKVTDYYRAEVEVKVLDTEAVIWRPMATEGEMDDGQMVPRYPEVLPRAATPRTAIA